MTQTTLQHFRVINHLENNVIAQSITQMIPDLDRSAASQKLFELNFNFLVFRDIQISLIKTRVHDLLRNNSHFYREKALLEESTPMTGLLLLKNPIITQTELHEELKVSCVFFSWLRNEDHFRIAGLSEDKIQTLEKGMSLLLVLAHNDEFIVDPELCNLYCRNTDYDAPNTFDSAYTEIQDLVMSFILFQQNQDVYDKVLFEENGIRRYQIQYKQNEIEIIE